MNTQRESWNELASREADGIVVSLLWSSEDGDLKVVVADTRLRTQFEFAVAPDRALDAFHHPFVYAGPEVRDRGAAPDAGSRRLRDRLSTTEPSDGASDSRAESGTGFRGERRPIPAPPKSRNGSSGEQSLERQTHNS